MTYLTNLKFPNRDVLLGGDEESAWILDRERKVDLIVKNYRAFLSLSLELETIGALYHCTPSTLMSFKNAADWYVSLAGYSIKTLRNIPKRYGQFGLTRKVEGLVKKLREGGSVPLDQLEAFSAWINFEIESQFPTINERTRQLALSVVLMILGGRVIGQSQNIGGNDAVDLLKTLIIQWFERKERLVEAEINFESEEWITYNSAVAVGDIKRIRINGMLRFEFVSGGDRPDIRIFNRSIEVAVGEIKGRKDLSNAWESWLPGLYNHLRTWMAENVDRGRLFFGTLISEEMYTGITSRGTTHNGLSTMHNQGLLLGAYNLSNIVSGIPAAANSFDELMNSLDRFIS